MSDNNGLISAHFPATARTPPPSPSNSRVSPGGEAFIVGLSLIFDCVERKSIHPCVGVEGLDRSPRPCLSWLEHKKRSSALAIVVNCALELSSMEDGWDGGGGLPCSPSLKSTKKPSGQTAGGGGTLSGNCCLMSGKQLQHFHP